MNLIILIELFRPIKNSGGFISLYLVCFLLFRQFTTPTKHLSSTFTDTYLPLLFFLHVLFIMKLLEQNSYTIFTY